MVRLRAMRWPLSPRWTARILVSAAAILPYLPVLTLSKIYITDDWFTSDIFNGELPSRVLVGKVLASGQAPVWSSAMCAGYPLAALGVSEPVSLLLFTLLPAAPALCLLVLGLVLVAAHGAYGFARRLGAERSGAILAGMAYAGSGYMVTQLKHLSIISTVVWLPWGLLLLDRALASRRRVPADGAAGGASVVDWDPPMARRLFDLGLFGLVLAEQALSGFPQSTYYSALVYGIWAAVQLFWLRGRLRRVPRALVLASAAGLVGVLAVMVGAVALLPLAELGKVAVRVSRDNWDFATMFRYPIKNIVNFLVPYANGDASNATYNAGGIFWEYYGYAGAATAVLAAVALVVQFMKPRVLLLGLIAVGAYLMVLGSGTPAFHAVWKYMPGMKGFRFPTRFLFVVDMAIAVLAAIGLGAGCRAFAWILRRRLPWAPTVLAYLVCAGTAVDLTVHQSRQNPFVGAAKWLTPPASVRALRESGTAVRTFAPADNKFHSFADMRAHGWANVTPYFELRESLAPNLGVYWGVPSVACYTGIAPKWYVDVWGDQNGSPNMVRGLLNASPWGLGMDPSVPRILETYGVTHVLAPAPIQNATLKPFFSSPAVSVYAVPGKRARVVASSRTVASTAQAMEAMKRPDFDPNQIVLLHDPPAGTPSVVAAPAPPTVATATIRKETSRTIRLDVQSPQGGYLVLADTYYPGWRATVDGVPTPVIRANITSRAVAVTPGTHVVELHFEAAAFFLGLALSALALVLLGAWIAFWRRRVDRLAQATAA